MSVVLWTTLQSFLALQKIDYHIKQGKLYIRKNTLTTPIATACQRYVKKILKFTDQSKWTF
jgi:hypothetical protein